MGLRTIAQPTPETDSRPVVRAEPFWTDCVLLGRTGIPCLLFGVDGEGAHAATEYVDLASLDHLTDILTATVTDFCS